MAEAEFAGTDRYEVRRRLGAGGMGVVYEVFDRERNDQIALKTLRRLDANNIYHLKEEFRALSDVMHPNLVVLHELEVAQDLWFFTMELVHGMSLLEFLRAERYGFGHTGFDVPTADDPFRAPPLPPPEISLTDPSDKNRERLRFYLRQVATGIRALHQAGKLHRDIKPSNVMIDRSHRAVVLDFGLVTDFGHSRGVRPSETTVVGTPEYMAPEQGRRGTPTTAADWYSFGIVLYEALTGRLPFHGQLVDILLEKQKGPPPSPRTVDPRVPEDLDRLCTELLNPRPELRPKADEVIARLGGEAPELLATGPRSRPSTPAGPLLGREREVSELRAAFHKAKQGGAVTVRVYGESGQGKTELVRHVLRQISDEGGAVILESRCYQREAVPYKTVDSLIDRLTEYWCTLPREEATMLLPPDVAQLVRIFPVIRRVPAVAKTQTGALIADAREQRQRGFDALIETMSRIATLQPLVLFIDDVQWGDVDSLALLAELMRLPAPACLLLVLSHRLEDVALSPPVRLLFGEARPRDLAEVRELPVRPLDQESAEKLALSMLGGSSEAHRKLAQRIAVESAGSPWFVQELARDVQESSPGQDGLLPSGWIPNLGDVLTRRMVRLPDEASRLLEVVAVAGGPVPEEVAIQAAGVGARAREALAVLRTAQLVSARGAPVPKLIETYHDRIREAVVASLDDWGRRDCHARLGVVLEAMPGADPMTLLLHFKGAGDPKRISRYTLLAAEHAEQVLAFDQAAQLYHEALAYELSPAERARVLERQGAALANAGRGAEAAQSYEAARATLAGIAPEDPRGLRLGMLSAEQHLRSGRIAEGERTLREVTNAIGMAVPVTPGRVLLALGLERGKLKLRGIRFTKRRPEEIPEHVRLHLDLCHGAYVGFSLVDPLLAAYFQVHNLRVALDAGDPAQVSRSLSSEAVYHASIGGVRGRKRFQELMAIAEPLAAETPDPYTRALLLFQKGSGAYLTVEWRKALELHERALEILRKECTGAAWEIASGELLTNSALAHLGELSELAHRLPRMQRHADERGDRYAQTVLRLGGATMVHLARGQAEEARREGDEFMALWPSDGFLIQHFNHLVTMTHADLYLGEGGRALARVLAAWPRATRAHFLRIQEIRVELYHLRARAALAAAVDPRGEAELPGWSKKRLLALARSEAKRIAKDDLVWSAPLASSVLACLASMEGRTEEAAAHAERAAAGFDRAEMSLYAAASWMALGRMRGGDAGQETIAAFGTRLAQQGIVDPQRFLKVLLPGL